MKTVAPLGFKSHKEPAPAVHAAVGARVVVSFKKVAVLSKVGHKRLEEAARDPKQTSKRMFPVF